MSRRSPARARASLTERMVNKPMRIAAWAFGLAFLAIGVAGFVPGLTENANQDSSSGFRSAMRSIDMSTEVSIAREVRNGT